jgi:hypothetical protein
LVVLVAVALGVDAIRRRRAGFLQKATQYARLEQSSLDMITVSNERIADLKSRIESYGARVREDVVREANLMLSNARWELELDQQYAAYYEGLRLKYERAASRPWVTLGPDPHPPLKP